MRIYYDTEFIEDGRTIDLISIGMVAEDGRELYLINEAIATDTSLYDRIARHPWLMANVVPHLPMAPRGDHLPAYVVPLHAGERGGRFGLDLDDRSVMPVRQLRKEVRHFVQATPDVELWAWYGAYDHVCLAQMFGPMVNLPKGFPMWTNDLKQEVQRRGNPQLPAQDGVEHNALADATWAKLAYESLAA